jgi:hypothetical protein
MVTPIVPAIFDLRHSHSFTWASIAFLAAWADSVAVWEFAARSGGHHGLCDGAVCAGSAQCCGFSPAWAGTVGAPSAGQRQ